MADPVTALCHWVRRGEWMRHSPCGRYELRKTRLGSGGVTRYYAYRRGGERGCLAGPCETADAAWQACADDAMPASGGAA